MRSEGDAGVATVVGFVLVLALVVSYYAHVARTDIPRWGADAERAWDEEVMHAMTRLTRSASANIGTQASAIVTIPSPPPPRVFDVPLVGRTEPVRPSGTLAFDSLCSGVRASHESGLGTVEDVVDDSLGCVRMDAKPTYSPVFAYRSEFGGLLRVQGAKSVVLSGPPLELERIDSDKWRVAFTLVGYRGPSNSASLDRSAAPVDLVPSAYSAETGHEPNAADARWEFRTDYPSAWQQWFDARLTQAGFRTAPDDLRTYACIAGDPAPCPSVDPGKVLVVIGGPKAAAGDKDLALSFSYGLYDVSVG